METNQPTPQRDPYLWKQAKARVGFRIHLRSYFVVNTGLWLIWAFSAFVINTTSGHAGTLFPWPIFPMLGWGIGLVSHYLAIHYGNERDMIEREYQKLVNQ
ncbi:2TM domain-containing protein [Spirosoma pulveris]